MGRVKVDKEPKESSTKLLSKINEKSVQIQKRKVRRSNDLNSSISSASRSLNRSSLNDSVTLLDQLGGDETKAVHGRYINFVKYGDMSPWCPDKASTEREKEEGNEKSGPHRFLGIIEEEDDSKEEGEVKESSKNKQEEGENKYSDEKDIAKKTSKIESPHCPRRRLRSPVRIPTPRRKDSSRDFLRWRNNRRRSQTDRRCGRTKPRREMIPEPIERWARGYQRSSKPQAVINPGPTVSSSRSGGPRRKGELRPIVIDASNVARAHGRDLTFSTAGLELVVRDWQARGHKVTAILPQHERKHKPPRDQEKLEKLYEAGVLNFTPSREFKGERIYSHDDSYILDNAAKTGAVVVTRDQFRDLTGKKREWDEVIKNRLLAPFFDKDGGEEFIQWPNDPLGPWGPTLDEFLRF